jgi:hypothetical protein
MPKESKTGLRRIGVIATAAVMLAACADPEQAAPDSATPEELMPDALSCADATATDVAQEPAYSADYVHRWRTHDGCDVRLDFAMTRRGGCFEGVDDILIGWPLGTTHSHHDYRIYLRDPGHLSGEESGDGLQLDATLPGAAMNMGLRQENNELWLIPGDDEFIWLMNEDSIERWPQGYVSCA